MKAFFVSILLLAAFCRAQAQVNLALSLDQDEFLPNEPVRLTIKISNTSGQRLHLGADPNWLTFVVESADGFVVDKKGDPPFTEEFDLESSQMATLHVDLQPYFQMTRLGRYKVTGTMRIKAWGLAAPSRPLQFDVIHGGEVWEQDFGVTVTPNTPPEPRKYSLIKANYLREQLRLYVQVSDQSGAIIYKVAALGPMVSFSTPEESVDRLAGCTCYGKPAGNLSATWWWNPTERCCHAMFTTTIIRGRIWRSTAAATSKCTGECGG